MNRRDFLSRSAITAAVLAGKQPLVRGSDEQPVAPVPKALAGSTGAKRPAITGTLRVLPENRRYFTDGSGRAIYLSGSHTWATLVDRGPGDPPPKFDFPAYLDFLDRYDHNFIRLWTQELTEWPRKAAGDNDRTRTAAPHPYARTGPGVAIDGKPKFDLRQFDPEYFRRLRQRVEAAGKRGIYVSVMFFEGWALQFVKEGWKYHPFNPENNINGIGARIAKGLDIYTLADAEVTAVQEAYVRKVVDTVNDLDNVLYEISNENHPPSTRWQYHLIDLVHAYERGKPKQHPVGMTFQYAGGSNATLFESPADWISPNSEKRRYNQDPPAADGRKVILADTDHLGGIWGEVPWVWKSFVRGLNPIFMDPYDRRETRSGADWAPLRKAMGEAVRLSYRIDLAAMTPQNALASSGFCLAGRGKNGMEYVIYLPKGGDATVDLSGASGTLTASWLHPVSGETLREQQIEGGAKRQLTSPAPGDMVLWICSGRQGKNRWRTR